MLEALKNIDNAILLLINGHHSPFFDGFMMAMSNRFIWIPLYLILAYIVYRKFGNRGFLIIMLAGVAVGLSDQLASHLIKNMVMRYRPSHNLILATKLHFVNDYRGGLYGFVSSHAANTFALALFLSLMMPEKRKLILFLFCWVALVCYSRMYLGVHYPSDIAGGIIIGGFSAWLMYKIYFKLPGNYGNSNPGVRQATI